MCDQPVYFDNFKELASSNSKCDQPIFGKNEASLPLYLFDLVTQIFYNLMTI